SRRTWRAFARNLPALLGLGYVLLCLLVSLFACVIAPDNTRHANMQALELAKLPPGSEALLLMKPLGGAETAGFWDWIAGKIPDAEPVALAVEPDIHPRGAYVVFVTRAGVRDSLSLAVFGLPEGTETAVFTRKYVQKRRFWLGTDTYGRDLLSRILLGTRVSLFTGLMAMLLSVAIGVVVGALAGYFGGRLDAALMWLISVIWSVPTLLLALVISFILGKGFWQLFVAIGISMWVEVARMVRGQILSLREWQFTEAARTLGFGHMRILFRHILPNITGPLIVVAVANFGSAILVESGLSFLGIGVEVPIPTWGRMIYEGYTYIVLENGKWLAFFPGMALILLIVSINLIGIGLRDALEVT
ncbi:MAG: ABC transporter permease, partial [Bacteroidetes bacterium]